MRERLPVQPRENVWVLRSGPRPSFGVGHRSVLGADLPPPPVQARAVPAGRRQRVAHSRAPRAAR